jgi:hypothetical protein
MTQDVPTGEVKDAVEAVEWLRRGNTIAWAPGDSSRYDIALIDLDATGDRKGLLVIFESGLGEKVILIKEPEGSAVWDARTWFHRQLPLGQYGGIMPLIAALGWAGTRKLVYDPHAVTELIDLVEGTEE